MAPLAYFGHRISDNMTRTPEGFLVCHNVPIARTGWQRYLGHEIGLDGDMAEKQVEVYRDPEEVFKPIAVASFEGKSVTDGHPPREVSVGPDNYASYERGHVTNVRKATLEDGEDYLVADLMLKDPRLISDVEHGKREVSCGYECQYEETGEGKYRQVNIVGNHVAVVPAGRAGDRVAIKDGAPEVPSESSPQGREPERGRSERRRAVKSDRNTLVGKILRAITGDAEMSPEEITEGARLLAAHEQSEGAAERKAEGDCKDSLVPPTTEKPRTSDEPDPVMTAIQTLAGKVEALGQALTAHMAKEEKELAPEDPMDALVKELEGGQAASSGNGEASVTVEPEDIHDAEGSEAGSEEKKETVAGADTRAVILRAIKDIRPKVAAINDEAVRKQVSDALVQSFRQQMGAAKPGETKDGYATILAATAKNGQSAADAKPEDPEQLGKDIMANHNPHYMKKQKGGN